MGLIVWSAKVSQAAPMGTAFTYQGRLIDANNAADGLYDLQFKLYDVNVAGTQKGSTINTGEVDVIDGYFTVSLDFGSGIFDGNDRWLQIGVRAGALKDPNVYTFLSPRQQVSPVPYAIYAKTADSISVGIDWIKIFNIPAGFADGVDNTGITSETDPTVLASVKDGITWTEVSNRPAGLDDGDQVGITSETDPTVLASVKDGVSWSEVSNIPAGFADGVDNTGITSETDPTVLASVKDGITWTEVFNRPAGLDDGDQVGITSESDPQVGSITTNYIPKWNGSALVSGTIYDSGNVGIGTSTPDEKLTVVDGTVKATSSLTTGRGVYGVASNSGNYTNFGGFFEAAGSTGRGVRGWASNGGNYENYGGWFQASGSTARGVRGWALNSGNYENYGGYFQAAGSTGRGVYGEASNSGNYANYGGYFQAAGSTGRGVYGEATGSKGRGVYGWATGATGIGVYGGASNTGNYVNYGGFFEAAGIYGTGVIGGASGSSGIGVMGIAAQWDFFAAGTGMDYGSSSSIRWKRDIRPIDEALDKVMQLRGVYFNWDAEHGGQHDVGMVAEEVGEVVPEIVQYEPNSVYATGMDYSKLTPLLVEAVKALKTEVDQLQKENADLRNRVEAMEKMMTGGSRLQIGVK